MLLQLDPPLPLETPKGAGLAHILVDYGPEHDLYWTVFLDTNGECWTFSNREVRALKNISLGRVGVEKPRSSPHKAPQRPVIGPAHVNGS